MQPTTSSTGNTVNPAVVVYGASSSHIHEDYFRDARLLGQLLAQAGITVVNGGGRNGLMGATIEGAIEANGHTIGIIPQFMVDRGWQHPSLSQVITTPTMHVRKATMAGMTMAAIALPGGVGTFEELLEIITWRQLKLYTGQVVILNTNGYYDPLLQMLQRAHTEGFSRKGDGNKHLYSVADTPQQALDIILHKNQI